MSNEEILRQAILKAKTKGYEFSSLDQVKDLYPDEIRGIIFSHDFVKAFWGTQIIADCGLLLMPEDFEEKLLVLRSDPDKWDEYYALREKNPQYCYEQDDPECPCSTCEAWEYHIQQLALAEDRIGYLAKFL